ncbi:hypothetical protein IFM89_010344 [Coptis chinensis]|uniref:Wall-associated receptor kinase C-terminal domain-containing protein n=1 Tax=Coptis chinensis TaxID=261450 RepID=A0A835HV06_9MAGN|nr:hypothetical protein IFM89_010344 [Coptis chinensis]
MYMLTKTTCLHCRLKNYTEGHNWNITQALKLGFPLSWSAPSDCEDCERSGGQCQYNSTGASRCHRNNGEFRDRICPQTHPGISFPLDDLFNFNP